MRYLWTLAFIAVLSACQGKPINQLSYAETRALAAEIEKRCDGQGIGANHPERQACLTQEVTRENALRNDAERRRQAVARSTTFCQSYGSSVVCF